MHTTFQHNSLVTSLSNGQADYTYAPGLLNSQAMDLLKDELQHFWIIYSRYDIQESLMKSLYLAPLFVWLEVLFAFGYRPALKRAIAEEVEADKRARGVGAKKVQ